MEDGKNVGAGDYGECIDEKNVGAGSCGKCMEFLAP